MVETLAISLNLSTRLQLRHEASLDLGQSTHRYSVSHDNRTITWLPFSINEGSSLIPGVFLIFQSVVSILSISLNFSILPMSSILSKYKKLEYLIRTNFRGHLISRIWNTNISRALIFAILQKMINSGHLISRKLTKDTLKNRGGGAA